MKGGENYGKRRTKNNSWTNMYCLQKQKLYYKQKQDQHHRKACVDEVLQVLQKENRPQRDREIKINSVFGTESNWCFPKISNRKVQSQSTDRNYIPRPPSFFKKEGVPHFE